MTISAEQLARIVIEVFDTDDHLPYDLSQPKVVWDRIRDKYPELDHVGRPPRVESIRRDYVLEDAPGWQAPASNWFGNTYSGPLADAAIEYGQALKAAGLTPDRLRDRLELLVQLNHLRGSSITALGYVIAVGMGRNLEEAARVARSLAGVYQIISMMTPDSAGGGADGTVPGPYAASEIRSRLDRGNS